ncbi:DUF2950 family protein (plasmid) [Cupriavidus necator]|nr:DUF2950 family protein [Cupriavidus necator]
MGRTSKGWHFNTSLGVEEMRVRRIGRNELAVMQTLLAAERAGKQRVTASPRATGSRLLPGFQELIAHLSADRRNQQGVIGAE